MERCRTCAKFEGTLNSKKWRQLYPTTQRDLVDVRELLRSWNIKFERKDQFSQKICDVCYNNFCLVQKFRENCKHADKIIRSNIKNNTASDSLMEFMLIEKKCSRGMGFLTNSSDAELNEWNSVEDEDAVKQQVIEDLCHTNIKNCGSNVQLMSTVKSDVDEATKLKFNRELVPLSLIDVANKKSTPTSETEVIVDGCNIEMDSQSIINTRIGKIKNISQVADVVFEVSIHPVDPLNIQTAKITQNYRVADVLDVSIDKETESTAVPENTSNTTGAHDDNDDEYEKRNDIICSLELDFLNEECSEAENELISQLVAQMMVNEKKQATQEKTDKQNEEKKKRLPLWKRNIKYDEIIPNPLLCLLCVSYNAKDLLHHTVEDLEAHKQKVHSNADNPINCLICNQFFKDEDEIHLHLKDKHIPGENCLICGKFSRNRSLGKHIGTHLKSSYTCEICGLVLKESTQQQFDYHKRWHNSKKQLQCPYKGCMQSFLQRHHLNEHIGRWHTGQRQFICTECGMGFSAITVLKEHNFKFHKGESIIKCSHCTETFNTYVQKQTHMSKMHPSTSQWTCNICNRSYKSDNRLWQHVQKMHDTSPQLKTTSQKLNSKHKTQKKVPRQRGLFECSYCNHCTNTESSLTRHQIKHTPDVSRPFSCQECYSFFKNMINLRIHHKLVHLKEKPFKCNICDKSFSLQWILKNHIKTHNPVKINCDQCERKFKSKICLRKHQLMKHEKSFRFKCDYCDEKFLCPQQRIAHMKKNHDGLYYRMKVKNSLLETS